ncbi:MAG: GNAT family N-acetyltransferase [Gammaproteobacteria bacterium]|nr:GNAT family N-acetyltransferase [Gammaproteobacteria bacterium]
MSMQKYFLTTNRLGLRLLKKEDVEILIPYESDPDVQRFTPNGVKTREQTERMIDKCLLDYEKTGLPCFLIFDLATDEFIGRAVFFVWEGEDIEVGYGLHKKFWGRGYATEVLTILLQWAKNNISKEYITAYSDINNTSSIRVLEKCGMEYYKSDMHQGRFYRIKNG